MALSRFYKQISEEFPIGADFSENMESTETISSQTISAVDTAGADATADILENPTNDGAQMALIKVKAGTEALSPYKITFKVTTSLGYKWELDVEMQINEL